MTDAEAYREYVNAAIALATSVDVTNKIATDPTYPGERGHAAEAARDQMHRDDIKRFRAAQAAFLQEVTTK